jgi:hypothetical protein
MRLLRFNELEIGPQDRVFRHPRLRVLILWVAGFGAASAGRRTHGGIHPLR